MPWHQQSLKSQMKAPSFPLAAQMLNAENAVEGSGAERRKEGQRKEEKKQPQHKKRFHPVTCSPFNTSLLCIVVSEAGSGTSQLG